MAINVQHLPMDAAGAVASASGKRSYQQYLDQIALNNSQLQEQQRQYNTSQGESARQFDLGLSERQRQFDLGQQQQAEMFNADYFQKQNLAQFNAQANVLQNTIGQLGQNERLSQQIAANERLANFNRLAGLERQANQANIQYGMNYQDAYLRDALAQEQFGRQQELAQQEAVKRQQMLAYEAAQKGISPSILAQKYKAEQDFEYTDLQQSRIDAAKNQIAQAQTNLEKGIITPAEFALIEQSANGTMAQIMPTQPKKQLSAEEMAQQTRDVVVGRTYVDPNTGRIATLQEDQSIDWQDPPKKDPNESQVPFLQTPKGNEMYIRTFNDQMSSWASANPGYTAEAYAEASKGIAQATVNSIMAMDRVVREGITPSQSFSEAFNSGNIYAATDMMLEQQQTMGQQQVAPPPQQQPVLAPEPVQPPPQMQQPAQQQAPPQSQGQPAPQPLTITPEQFQANPVGSLASVYANNPYQVDFNKWDTFAKQQDDSDITQLNTLRKQYYGSMTGIARPTDPYYTSPQNASEIVAAIDLVMSFTQIPKDQRPVPGSPDANALIQAKSVLDAANIKFLSE